MTQVDPAMERAKEYVKDVQDVWYHLMVFVLVNALLIFIDLRGGANNSFLGLDWAFWVVFGWGFGLAGHAISVFFGDYRVQRMYEKEKSRELHSR